ncbi:MAG: DUF5677 domain-containing protein [Phycisphaerae bacterium]|nr:DUF5677 domain-containing protein [Phycisphaerae bacterium]
MKATENTENINIVSNKINQWFDETFVKLKTSKRNEVDLIVAAILLACRKYSLAVSDLMKNKHIIPAQALLRVLLEIYAVLMWCIAPHREEDDKKQQVHNRFQKWDFLRAKEHKKLLEILDINQYTNDIRKLEEQVATYQKRGIKCLLGKRDIFEELAKEQDKDWIKIYAKYYLYYNRAVHLDMSIVRDLVVYDSNEKTIFYKNDFEQTDELGTLLSISCDINMLVRQFYGWPYEHLKSEYRIIIKEMKK